MAPLNASTLRSALYEGQLVYHYQPKISFETGSIVGAEALARWQQPDGSLISPAAFIPLAVETGLIREMTLAMLPSMVAELSRFQAVSPDLTLSFNLTAQDLQDDATGRLIAELIAEHSISPDTLQAEIVETSVIDRQSRSAANLLALTDMGLGLAMDDFGSGYASLSVLNDWPFSVLKIDRGLVTHVLKSQKAQTILRASIHMARHLQLVTVAEGVETRETFDFLLNTGCSQAQGYFMARPMRHTELLTLLAEQRTWLGLPTGLILIAQFDHLEWRRRIVEYTVARQHGLLFSDQRRAIDQTLSQHQCHFGRWYSSQRNRFSQSPQFKAIHEPHAALHASGRRLLEALDSGAPESAVDDLLRQLMSRSEQVQRLLQALEVEGILQARKNARA